MTLCDAGPLVALADRDEPAHSACAAALAHLSAPLLTTWAAFTEAMYLVGDGREWAGQDALWTLVERGDLQVVAPDVEDLRRLRDLVAKYRDLPMDLADATLIVAAEKRRLRRVFTLDGHFRLYQMSDGAHLEVVP